MADLSGKDFVAVCALYDRSGAPVAAAGETCVRVPAVSLYWLREQGYIQPIAIPQSPEAAPIEDAPPAGKE